MIRHYTTLKEWDFVEQAPGHVEAQTMEVTCAFCGKPVRLLAALVHKTVYKYANGLRLTPLGKGKYYHATCALEINPDLTVEVLYEEPKDADTTTNSKNTESSDNA